MQVQLERSMADAARDPDRITVFGFTFEKAAFESGAPWPAKDVVNLVAEAYADGWRAGASAAANAAMEAAVRTRDEK